MAGILMVSACCLRERCSELHYYKSLTENLSTLNSKKQYYM